jgi:hypothetical protein
VYLRLQDRGRDLARCLQYQEKEKKKKRTTARQDGHGGHQQAVKTAEARWASGEPNVTGSHFGSETSVKNTTTEDKGRDKTKSS